jgi:hypothetical protein
MEFKDYQSKPIVRRAMEILPEHTIDYREDNKVVRVYFSVGYITAVAHEKVNVGDFIVYLSEEDIYHCRREVFMERNIVEEG